jgi:PAS domain S-box-containing protein
MITNFPVRFRLRTIFLFLAGFLFLYMFWLVRGNDTLWERFWIGHLTIVFTSALCTRLGWFTRNTLDNAQKKQAWTFLSAGLSIWLLHDVFFLFSDLLGRQSDWLAWMGGLYFLGGVFIWIGIFAYPRKARSVFGRLRLVMDLLLTSIAVILLLWTGVIQPALDVLQPMAVPGLIYISVDLISLLILVNLFLLSEIEQLSTTLSWFVFAFLVYSFSDMSYMDLMNNQLHYSSGNVLDFGWVVGDMLLLAAVFIQLYEVRLQPDGFLARLFLRSQSLLPIFSVLMLGWYALLNWQISGKYDMLSLWGTVGLGLGLLVRQGILAGETTMEQYARLVNSIAEPAFVCDTQGRLQMMNPAFLEICALSRNEAWGAVLQDFLMLAIPDHTWLKQVYSDSAQKRFSGSTREVYLKQKDGQQIPVLLTLSPIESARNQRLAFAGTAHDLRLQKQQQASLQSAYEEVATARSELERLNSGLERLVNERTQDLQSAYRALEEQNIVLQQLDQLKSDFVSLVSHELRAPLTNIRAGIELLLVSSGASPLRMQVTLERVQSEILRLSQFTETILDLSALDANRLPLYPEPMPLQVTINALQTFYQQVQGSERIRWEIPSNLPPILADQKALHSVLFHLLDNALKYAPEGDIVITAAVKENMLQIQVLDSGPGIPDEALSFLFERFFRAHQADSQTAYGHGLGLYLVRRFVEAMQGWVSVENRSEVGVCFSVYLPLVDSIT